MADLPPGAADARPRYYIRIANPGNPFFNQKVHWVARYTNDARHWNVTPYHADGFISLAHAKAVMRTIARRQDTKGAEITIVEVTYLTAVRTAFPEEVLDRLARVV